MKTEDVVYNIWVPHPYPMTKGEVAFKIKKWEWLQGVCRLNESGYCGYCDGYYAVSCSMKNCRLINSTARKDEASK